MSGRFDENELWVEIRAWRTQPPPVTITVSLPDQDDDDGDDDDFPSWEAQSISGRALVIQYMDSKGQPSERQIMCRRLDLKGPHLYLFAYCYAREKIRNFRADRIVMIVDSETGEVHEPGITYLELFTPQAVTDAPFRYGLSPQGYADFNAALNVLLFMARCDGKFHPLEEDRIEDFAASYWLKAEITTAFDQAEIMRHARRLAPDAETFWVSLTRCKANPLLRSMIRRHVSAVIDADGAHHDKELFWGAQIDNFLSA